MTKNLLVIAALQFQKSQIKSNNFNFNIGRKQ